MDLSPSPTLPSAATQKLMLSLRRFLPFPTTPNRSRQVTMPRRRAWRPTATCPSTPVLKLLLPRRVLPMSDHACTLTFVPRISAGRSKVKSGYTPLDLVGLHLLSCAKSGSFGARFFVLLKIHITVPLKTHAVQIRIIPKPQRPIIVGQFVIC